MCTTSANPSDEVGLRWNLYSSIQQYLLSVYDVLGNEG